MPAASMVVGPGRRHWRADVLIGFINSSPASLARLLKRRLEDLGRGGAFRPASHGRHRPVEGWLPRSSSRSWAARWGYCAVCRSSS